MNKELKQLLVELGLLFGGIIFGFLAGVDLSGEVMRTVAIEHHAGYDDSTGKFHWNNEIKP